MISAAIVTIGTEITDGQIVDSNSQWLSRQLDALQIKINLHLSVPDEREHMLSALTYAHSKADIVFVCGGLGPTSDDFTRDIAAELLAVPLVHDEPSWRSIEAKLSQRPVTIRDGHRRQALIPQGALALSNDAGVAPGFLATYQNKKIWFLPGPPKEIAAIWTKHVLPNLEKSESLMNLKTWLCQGVPESELAHIAEEFFSRFTFAKKFGYRLEWPCVEIKLWYEKDSAEALKAVAEFTALIERHLKKI